MNNKTYKNSIEEITQRVSFFDICFVIHYLLEKNKEHVRGYQRSVHKNLNNDRYKSKNLCKIKYHTEKYRMMKMLLKFNNETEY